MIARSHIMIHHSLTADSGTVSWAAIEKFHREDPTHGWLDIGYHAGVEQVAPVSLAPFTYQALMGRALHMIAAACPQGNMNSLALHVCCVGNFDLAPPSAALLDRLVQRVVRPWMIQYGISPERIIGHRDFNPAKSCPGRLFDLEAVRRLVR